MDSINSPLPKINMFIMKRTGADTGRTTGVGNSSYPNASIVRQIFLENRILGTNTDLSINSWKVKRLEEQIKNLEEKLKEKENLSSELECAKQDGRKNGNYSYLRKMKEKMKDLSLELISSKAKIKRQEQKLEKVERKLRESENVSKELEQMKQKVKMQAQKIAELKENESTSIKLKWAKQDIIGQKERILYYEKTLAKMKNKSNELKHSNAKIKFLEQTIQDLQRKLKEKEAATVELEWAKQEVYWEMARIQYLEKTMEEMSKVSDNLKSLKEENGLLKNKISELNQTLYRAERELFDYKKEMEKKTYVVDIVNLKLALAHAVRASRKLQEKNKRSEEDSQKQISSLRNENISLKSIKVELENENMKMMEKCKELEQKFTNEKIGCLEDCEDHCCEVGRAKAFKLIEFMEQELTCAICGDMFAEAAVTNCHHTFCGHCLNEWNKLRRRGCPLCRTHIVAECKISFLDEFINYLLKLFSPKTLDERLRLTQEKTESAFVEPPLKKRLRGRTVR